MQKLALLSFLLFLAAARVHGEAAKSFPAISTVKEAKIESDTTFTFLVTGDGRPTAPDMPLPQSMHDIVREAALLRPAFILYTGDTIFGYGDSRQGMLNEIDRFRALIDRCGVPVFNCPGNHEVQSDPAARAILLEKGQEMFGSFDVGKYHFVALNTDEVNEEQDVAAAQVDWLQADLEAHKLAAGIFVFMHRPLDSWFRGDFNPDTATRLRQSFVKYGVKAVFAGHDHYYDQSDRDGVHYVTAGGAGAPLYAEPPKGGYSHYLLVNVSPKGVTYQVLEPNHLEVAYIAGNDGFEPVSAARVTNSSATDVLARNLSFRVPRMPGLDSYKVTGQSMDEAQKVTPVVCKIREAVDQRDGSAQLAVELPLAAGTSVRVTVEAREAAKK